MNLSPAIALPILFAVLAPFVGSFLGVLALRLPERRPVLLARSQCEHCKATLGAVDLVPLASWLLLRGRCGHCGRPIGAFPPAMELSALLVVLWAASVTSGDVFIASCFLGWILLALAVIDWRVFLLPDALTLPLAILGLVAAWVLDRAGLTDHLIGGAAGFLVPMALALAYRRWRGREGLGVGDAKLLGALGLWVTWQGLPAVVLYAAIAGLAASLVQSLRGQELSATTRIPLGAYLALGGWLVWLYGPLTV